MNIYLKSVYFNLGLIVNVPTFLLNKMIKMKLLKKLQEWDKRDKKLLSLMVRVLNILYYGLNGKEFNTISTHQNTKDFGILLTSNVEALVRSMNKKSTDQCTNMKCLRRIIVKLPQTNSLLSLTLLKASNL